MKRIMLDGQEVIEWDKFVIQKPLSRKEILKMLRDGISKLDDPVPLLCLVDLLGELPED